MKKIPITEIISKWQAADERLEEQCKEEICEYDSISAYKGYMLGFDDGVNSQDCDRPCEAMTLNEYQERAMSTCMPSCQNMSYMLLNMISEVGELAGKVAKPIRKESVIIRDNLLSPAFLFEPDCLEAFDDMKREMALELGDVLWMVQGCASRLGYSLEDIATMNINKLASRAKRGKIDGDGDHR